jgi:hypothetical protein
MTGTIQKGELGTLGLELGNDRIDAADAQPEMIEALIRGGRRRVDTVAGNDRRDEDIDAPELEVDARLALLHAAEHLGAEHAFVVRRRRLRIGAAQMDMIIGELRHDDCSVFCRRFLRIKNIQA